ncbi:RHS repeat domain-containing protein [Tenacibaculum agarivorans]|uniref:RHS repeat domain-containing protein n=1 Tax=Tenacibaculum agarivorans TaxID=1908389 RepID=UPI0009F86344|nr:RHS repeat-associated core domain-containing protein [Tenacibaculum agarivorans]
MMYQNTYRNFLFFGGIPPKKCNRLKKIDDNYTYDALNRITQAIDNTGKYDLQSVLYDKNGNITQLIRNGHTNASATSFFVMDYLTYTYDDGNKLNKVVDIANKTFGFKDGNSSGNDYSYDANGNMTVDRNKGITGITYNHLNLPTRVTINGKNIDYTYDATGMKLSKTVENITTDYASGYIYENNELQFFNHAEGYISPELVSGSLKFDYVYQYKDHLGNVRLSYTDANNDGQIVQSEIIEESNYYPFGLKHKGYNDVVQPHGNSTAQKFGFGGKELNEELGLEWHDFDARNYDASLGRWMNLDPLAEQMRRHSPYNYAFNNPIYYIDPDGMSPQDIILDSKMSKTERKTILADLQKLTDDKLTMDGNKVIIAKKNKGKKENGTGLIRDLIGHDKTVTIKVSNTDQGAHEEAVNESDSTNGTGSDSIVTIGSFSMADDLKTEQYKLYDGILMPLVEDQNTGQSVNEEMPNEIALGHELAHSLATLDGASVSLDKTAMYRYRGKDGKFKTEWARTEELYTTGIYSRPSTSKRSKYYSENDLRKDRGMNKRIKY